MNQSFLQTTLKCSFLITDTRQTLSDKPAVSARIITTSCCIDDKNLFFSGRIFSENVTILQQWHNINGSNGSNGRHRPSGDHRTSYDWIITYVGETSLFVKPPTSGRTLGVKRDCRIFRLTLISTTSVKS